MSRIRPIEGLLLNLDQKIAPSRREYLDREAAYQTFDYRTENPC